MRRMPLDAFPDLSDVQVIVYTNWVGQSPNLIEDQVTYPIVSALISAPKVKTVRGFTFFGFSYVYVIFQDGTDLYWARSRVLEYLNGLKGQLPEGVNPTSARTPPASAGASSTRSWTRPAATRWRTCGPSRTGTSPTGCARCRAWPRSRPSAGSRSSTRSTSIPTQARLLRDRAERRARAPSQESTATSAGAWSSCPAASTWCAAAATSRASTTCARSRSVPRARRARPSISPTSRRSTSGPRCAAASSNWTAQGEAVGGVVVIRAGENVLARHRRGEGEARGGRSPSFPPGVELEVAYDRSELIHRAIATLRRTLIEEVIVVAFVILIFLFHFRSALVPITVLPVAIVVSFLPMYSPARHLEHHVARRPGAGDRRARGRLDRHGRERVPAPVASRSGAGSGRAASRRSWRPRSRSAGRSSSRWSSSSSRSCRSSS